MRWMFFSVFLASAGCFFTVDGVKLASDQPGGGNTDDLADGTPADLAVTPSGGDDLAMPMVPVDMAVPPGSDLAIPFTPSHIAASDFRLGTQPLTVTMTIRTDPGSL